LAHAQIQADENAFGVREIPDDLLDRFGRRRTSVGIARNLIALASCGFCRRSMISIS
jgi:hypothetical protein